MNWLINKTSIDYFLLFLLFLCCLGSVSSTFTDYKDPKRLPISTCGHPCTNTHSHWQSSTCPSFSHNHRAADPVSSPAPAVSASIAAPASVSGTDSLTLLHAFLSTAPLYHTQSDRRFSTTTSVSSSNSAAAASANTSAAPASSSSSDSAPAYRPAARHTSFLLFPEASAATSCTVPVPACCELASSCSGETAGDGGAGADCRTAASPSAGQCAAADHVIHHAALSSAKAAFGKTSPGKASSPYTLYSVLTDSKNDKVCTEMKILPQLTKSPIGIFLMVNSVI